jgi:hypothetical protein
MGSFMTFWAFHSLNMRTKNALGQSEAASLQTADMTARAVIYPRDNAYPQHGVVSGYTV